MTLKYHKETETTYEYDDLIACNLYNTCDREATDKILISNIANEKGVQTDIRKQANKSYSRYWASYIYLKSSFIFSTELLSASGMLLYDFPHYSYSYRCLLMSFVHFSWYTFLFLLLLASNIFFLSAFNHSNDTFPYLLNYLHFTCRYDP